ncbi:uncharacterized protein ACIBXB_012799 [Morphnus guianensis]
MNGPFSLCCHVCGGSPCAGQARNKRSRRGTVRGAARRGRTGQPPLRVLPLPLRADGVAGAGGLCRPEAGARTRQCSPGSLQGGGELRGMRGLGSGDTTASAAQLGASRGCSALPPSPPRTRWPCAQQCPSLQSRPVPGGTGDALAAALGQAPRQAAPSPRSHPWGPAARTGVDSPAQPTPAPRADRAVPLDGTETRVRYREAVLPLAGTHRDFAGARQGPARSHWAACPRAAARRREGGLGVPARVEEAELGSLSP